MSFVEKQPRKWGDRRDGVRVRDLNGLGVLLPHLFPRRTESEVYLHQEIDVTELLKFIDAKNGPDAEYKTTIFHAFVAMVARVINERHYLNRFVQGRRVYERDEISISFVAKKRFTDHSEEALMQYIAKGSDNLHDISLAILGDVHEMREADSALGIDDTINKIVKLPRIMLMFVMKVARWLDFWGKVPKALTDGDSNYATVLISNLGSIKCPAVYHHLNNYGTTSVLMTIGAKHTMPAVMNDGSVKLREFIDIGVTLDERIADGFYFAKSLKLIQHICSHPEILDMPLEEDSGYEFV